MDRAQPTAAASRATATVERTSVLIVDDSPLMLNAIAGVLGTDESLKVVGTAIRIGDAVTTARQLRPDVAVIDVNMPGGGGWALARRLRQSVPGIRLVAYSAIDDPRIPRTLAAAGVAAYVIKGSDVELLLAAIHGEDLMPPSEQPVALVGRSKLRSIDPVTNPAV
jgi:two-component system, NarL family, response regulator DesR